MSYPPPLKEVSLPEPTAEEISVTIGPMVMPYSWSVNNISATLPTVPVYQSGGEFGMDKPISIMKVATQEVVDVLLVSNVVLNVLCVYLLRSPIFLTDDKSRVLLFFIPIRSIKTRWHILFMSTATHSGFWG